MFFAAVVTLIILNTTATTNPVLQSFPKIFPTKTIVSQNTLTLSPNPRYAQPGKSTSVQVMIDSQGSKPSLIQLELSYDPTVFSNVRIVPGTFFQNPDVLLNDVNTRNGRISYAISPSKGQADKSASNIVATLHITPRLSIAKRETTLSFMPKTIVQTEESKTTLKGAYGTKLLFTYGSAPIASPAATF